MTLIIPVYQNRTYLKLILDSLENQTYKEFEIIITEDGCCELMNKFIKEYMTKSDLKLTHITQQDYGFRKALAVNRAIKLAKNEMIIFIDGDCIVHKCFIESYYKAKDLGDIFIGRRLRLGKKITNKALNYNKYEFSFLELILSDSVKKEIKETIYFYGYGRKSKNLTLLGANFAMKKSLLLKINGYDEDYVGYGCEDMDIELRAIRAGGKVVSMKNKAIVYHLWHEEKKDRNEEAQINYKRFLEVKASNNYKCKNGIEKL